MSDSDATTTAARTAPVRWPSGKKKVPATAGDGASGPAGAAAAASTGEDAAAPAEAGGATAAGPQTGPVPARPADRARRSGPLTRMGPWAPMAGALVGIVLGV